MKELKVFYGPVGNQQGGIVQLNGVASDEPLTPQMARDALRIAGTSTGTVWQMSLGDPETGAPDYSQDYGYRVYARSARKIYPDLF